MKNENVQCCSPMMEREWGERYVGAAHVVVVERKEEEKKKIKK